MKKWILTIILIFGFFLSVSFVSASLWDDIELYYDFNSTDELVTREYNLTNNEGTPTFTTTNALLGKSGRITTDNNWLIENNTGTNIGDGNRSLNFWVRLDSVGGSEVFLNKYEGASSHVYFQLAAGPTFFWVFGGDGHTGPLTVINTWYMVTMVHRDSNISIYINGTLEYNNLSTALTDIPGIVKLGCYLNDGFDAPGYMDEMGWWNRSLNSTEVTELYNNGNALGYVSLEIEIDLVSPADNSTISDVGTNFTANYDTNILYDLTNTTYYIWNSTEIFNNSVFIEITGDTNSTDEYIDGFVLGNYEWNVYACYKNPTYSNCRFVDANYSFEVGAAVNSIDYNSSSYETARESFVLNITSMTGYTPTNAYLNYNGTDYSATITNIGGKNYTLSRTINVPLLTGNKSFYFRWDLGSYSQNSSDYNQTVSGISFNLCNATLNIPFINITFKDEETNTFMNATIDASTWYHYLGTGIPNKSYSYNNLTNHSSYAFCFSPPDRTTNLNYIIQYSFPGYPQRRYENISSYSNITTNLTLYLLPTADGIYVTYQVISAAEQPISGVYATAERQVSGTWEMIGSGYTGDDGGVTFWLNPDYTHMLTFSKTGYNTLTKTHTPTQSTYTVYLSTTAVEANITDYSRGITYLIAPTDYVLNNRTDYEFNFTISSDYWDLDEFGFVLMNKTGYNLGSISSTTGTGGTVSLTINTGNHSNIVMNYYWVIDGNYSNASRMWYVSDTGDYGFSIKTFFTHLKDYTDQKIFGLNEFSRTLIIFFFIFIIVGTMCWVSGVYSPAAVIWEIVVLVALFDFGLGMIPTPINAIEHFITFFMFLIAIGITIWEVKR